jgi:Restriction endonuclease fold toxin 5
MPAGVSSLTRSIRPGSYALNGVKFDGFRAGVLIDAKGPGYATFVQDGQFVPWYTGADALADQARRQVAAAGGMKIEWHVAESEAATAIDNLFAERGISGIKIVVAP